MKNYFPLLIGAALISSTAQAGGLYLYESSGSNIGLASAGMAARAQDASVLAANPAGLAHVSGRSFSGSLIGLYGDAELDIYNDDSAGNIIGFAPLGSAYYSQTLNDKLTLGIGMYGDYGMSLNYDYLPVLGGVEIPNATTQALTLKPAMSYRINEQWSLGAALGIQYGMFNLEGKSTTGQSFETEDNDVQLNGQVGLLYEINTGTRLGVSYTTETKYEFDDIGQEAIAPQQLILSAYHQISDRWAVMGNVNWQDWSHYKTTIGSETQDTYQFAIGTQYQVNQDITWNVGFAYDTSIYTDHNHGDFTLPSGESYRIGTGFDIKLDNKDIINLSLESVLVESSQTSIGGTAVAGFDNPRLYFASIQYTWSAK